MNAKDVMRYGDRTWKETLARVPMSEWEEGGVCGVWSVKQIVAHLASYEALLVDILASFADEGRATPTLERLFANGPEHFNDAEVAARAGLSASETLAEYDALHAEAMAWLARLPLALLSEAGTVPWYGAEYALDDVLVYQYYGHKREHSAQVALFADQVGQRALLLDAGV